MSTNTTAPKARESALDRLKRNKAAQAETPAASETPTTTAEAVTQAVTGKTKTEKPAKVAKEPKAKPEPKVKVEKVPETADAALARLKQEKPALYGRVRSVDALGKRGPTLVTIVCDDKDEDGSERLRQIKVQDLFQVRYSIEYMSKHAKGKRAERAKERRAEKAKAAPAAETSTETAAS